MQNDAETLAFDDAGLAGQLFGPLNAHLELIADASDAQLQTRGTELTVRSASPARRSLLLNLFAQCYGLLRQGRSLRGEDILQGYEELLRDPQARLEKLFRDAGLVVSPRKTILARNTPQRRYMELLRSHEMVFATGPAGTGKTYLACAMAINAYKNKEVERIILTRPAVEAGERLGFLPGDLQQKIDPYLRPLYDALFDMLTEESDILYGYIVPLYPTLHTQGKDYIVNDVIVVMKERGLLA